MPDVTPLANHHILVTGGGSGIGFAAARQLLADGATVTIMGRSEAKLEKARDELKALGHDVRIAPGDVANEADMEAAVAAARDADGALHGCVAAAGTGTFGPILDQQREAWDAVMATNVTGTMLCIKHAGRAMTAAGGGSIVAISSIAGILTHRWMTPYCVSKAAIEMLVRNAADELGGAGIRVNAVRPGLVPTDLAAPLVNNPPTQADYLDQMPLSRLGTPDDIAEIVRFLIGPESSWITGQVIAVDGGHTLRRGPDLDHAARAVFQIDRRRPWAGMPTREG